MTTTVTLVHGTFARHGKWVQPQAALPSALRESPGTLVQPCCWSGQNLQSSRFKGARKLHDHLINLTATYPLAAHFVVAHSHGGNVAMYALRSPDGTLDERLADVHIITLSTPFITAERQRLRGGGGLFILVSALFLTFWQLLLALSTLLVMDVYRANPELSGSMWVVLVTYGILFFAGFMVLLPIWLSPLVYREQPSAKLRYVRRVFGGTADESTRRIQGPELDSSRLTIFRAPGDEASGLLGLTHLLTWLSRRLIAIGWWGVLGISIVAILLSVIPVVLGGSGETFQPLIIGLFTTLFLMSIVLTAVLYGSSIFLGWDTAFLAPHVKMTAESSPLGIAEVRLLETPPGLLAHGIYTSDALVNQVKARVTAGRRTAI